jgi:hypothetical protein
MDEVLNILTERDKLKKKVEELENLIKMMADANSNRIILGEGPKEQADYLLSPPSIFRKPSPFPNCRCGRECQRAIFGTDGSEEFLCSSCESIKKEVDPLPNCAYCGFTAVRYVQTSDGINQYVCEKCFGKK